MKKKNTHIIYTESLKINKKNTILYIITKHWFSIVGK